ncbi:rab escort protein 1 [Abrus precatorius]|uniref:Rab escort protein 1 n=1 Tax=Abrus precatorius TaxID=3816 RepID=A0A8B8LVJ8_ABRPR|nr:rab escort protein 1 [Abrus precatorius]
MTQSHDPFPYPPIDPVNFDLIIVGTGLSESVIAAAASALGKTVLHLDPNSFYGSHFASLSLNDLTSYLNSPNSLPVTATPPGDSDDVVIDLIRQPLCSDAEIVSCASDNDAAFLRENSRKFSVDLGGPRALFSADKMIDLLLKSGAAQYLEFKGIDVSLVYEANAGLVNVPDSRGAIFRDKNLSLKEKNQLMRFFKLVQQHLGENHEDGKISVEDMESPFVSFLEKMKLPPKIKAILLYAIAMVDYDQDNNEVCKDLLKTKDGIDRLAQYSSSVGRFPSAPGALLYPIYGEGELPQAFCRGAAVKGCIYVLRMPVISLLMDKVTGLYKGVRLASGQDLYSHQLILDPSLTIPSALSLSPRDFPCERLQLLNQRDIKGMVARGICITRSSIKPDVTNCSVVYPPRSLYPEQVTSIKALQIGSNLAVCPEGTFISYFSTLCNDADEGKKLLKAAMNALLTLPVSGSSESIPIVQSDSEDIKPIVLWSAFYIQKLITSKFEFISSTPTPDGSLNYNDLLDATEKLFGQMYPEEEFFPKTAAPEDTIDEDESGLTMES